MGESKYVDLFGWAQWKYAGRIAACFQMNHALAHRIYAGSDLFLMPSMFEPCGLSQLISLRYGTLPITRETGGLRDTVLAYNEFTGEGNGFTFFNYNAHDMLYVIERAVELYKEKRDVFNALAVGAMKGEYGWDKSAGKYIELYKDLLGIKDEAPAKEEKPAEEKPKRKPRAKKAEAPAEAASEEKPKRKRCVKKTEAPAEAPAAEEKPKRKPRAKKTEA